MTGCSSRQSSEIQTKVLQRHDVQPVDPQPPHAECGGVATSTRRTKALVRPRVCSQCLSVCVRVPDCDTIVSCGWVGSALESNEMRHTRRRSKTSLFSFLHISHAHTFTPNTLTCTHSPSTYFQLFHGWFGGDSPAVCRL